MQIVLERDSIDKATPTNCLVSSPARACFFSYRVNFPLLTFLNVKSPEEKNVTLSQDLYIIMFYNNYYDNVTIMNNENEELPSSKF